MNKKEIRSEAERRLRAGDSKTAIYEDLTGLGLRDAALAHQLASYVGPALRQRHSTLVNTMVAIAWIQLVIGALVGMVATTGMGLTASLVTLALLVGVSSLFFWGFSRDKAWAYNATILLAIANAPKMFTGLTETPVLSGVSLLIGLGVITFTWYVRSRLFPDFAFVTPRKVKGRYLFTT